MSAPAAAPKGRPGRKASVFAAQQWQANQVQQVERKGLERAATQKALEKFAKKTEKAKEPKKEAKPKKGGCCGGGDDVIEREATQKPREKTKEEKEIDAVVETIRSKGRTYEEGTVVLSFAELCAYIVTDEHQSVKPPTPQTKVLIATLLRARLTGEAEYSLEEEEEEEEGDRKDEDKALRHAKDDSVIITVQKEKTTSKWRRGSLMTSKGTRVASRLERCSLELARSSTAQHRSHEPPPEPRVRVAQA